MIQPKEFAVLDIRVIEMIVAILKNGFLNIGNIQDTVFCIRSVMDVWE